MGDELIGIDDDTQRFLDKVLRPVWDSENKEPVYDSLENKAGDENLPKSRNKVRNFLNRLKEKGIVKEKTEKGGKKYFLPVSNNSEKEDDCETVNASYSDLIGRIRDANISLDDVKSSIEEGGCNSVTDMEGGEEKKGCSIFSLPNLAEREIEDHKIDNHPVVEGIFGENGVSDDEVIDYMNLIPSQVEDLLDTLKSPYQTNLTPHNKVTEAEKQREMSLRDQIIEILRDADRDLTKNEVVQKIKEYGDEDVEKELIRLRDEENQLRECKRFCETREWTIEHVFKDKGKSAFKGEQEAKDNILSHARKGEFNHIVVWALDRWTREGAQKLIEDINRLESWNVKLHSVQEEFLDQFNMKGELGKILREFIQKILAWQAEMESKKKGERVKAAYQRKKERNENENWGRPEVNFDVLKAKELREKEGMSWRKIADELDTDVSYGTIRRKVKNM